MQVAKNMWQQCALVAVVIEKVQGSFLCKSFFCFNRRRKLVFSKFIWTHSTLLSRFGAWNGFRLRRKMSKKVEKSRLLLVAQADRSFKT
jgi:hypothetical protein